MTPAELYEKDLGDRAIKRNKQLETELYSAKSYISNLEIQRVNREKHILELTVKLKSLQEQYQELQRLTNSK